MKRLLAATLVIFAPLFCAPALAAPPEGAQKPVTPQQQRMRDCNVQAQGMKGQERKDFMKQCLSGKQAENKAAREERREEVREERKAERSAAQSSQQERMKACNVEAGARELKGDARKAFMSECLKAK